MYQWQIQDPPPTDEMLKKWRFHLEKGHKKILGVPPPKMKNFRYATDKKALQF